jgi:uncharacterized protein YwqG
MLWFALGLLAVLVLLAVAFAVWARAEATTPEEAARIEAAATAFLQAHHAAIEATRRAVVRIALLPMDADDLRASKVGGAAWWPADAALPRDAQERPLVLLAQVNLGELPESGLDLPAQGLLQFLVSNDGNYGIDYERDESPAGLAAARGHRVAYWPALDGPAQSVAAGTKQALPLDATPPLRMHFSVGTETLGLTDGRFAALFPGGLTRAIERHVEATGVDADALMDALWERDTAAGHKLGGYPNFTQDDPRTRTDLELLFQLDSDDGVMWGDAGVGNFFISDADLARRDFSRVLYCWDCC